MSAPLSAEQLQLELEQRVRHVFWADAEHHCTAKNWQSHGQCEYCDERTKDALGYIKPLFDVVTADLTRLRQEREELQKLVEARDGTLMMTVHRLGGMVEGRPTERVNFLQRVDELVRIEKEARIAQRDLLARVREMIEKMACPMGDGRFELSFHYAKRLILNELASLTPPDPDGATPAQEQPIVDP